MDDGTVVLVASKRRVPWQAAAALFGVTRISRRFGSWAVTDDRVACLTFPYDIPADDVHRTHGTAWSWEKQLGEKTWVVQADFRAAIVFARERFAPRAPRKVRSPRRHRKTPTIRAVAARLRFLILRRDAYRCRLCGATADEGARLHVDHRIPVSAGGPSTTDNLWTLCADCNLGKGRLPL